MSELISVRFDTLATVLALAELTEDVAAEEAAAMAEVRALLAAPNPAMPIEGKVNAGAPETGHEAARRRNNMIRWGNDRTKLLEALGAQDCASYYGWASAGCTAAELADRFGWSRNQTAARLLELREMGLVGYRCDDDGNVITEWTNEERTSRGRVQFITQAGRRALADLEGP